MQDQLTAVVLQQDLTDQARDTIGSVIDFLPRLIGALIILIIGLIVGRIVGAVVRRLVDTVQLDELVLDTPLGDALGGSERAVSKAFGVLARWFVYALAILAAADVLAITVLSEWIDTAVSYLPAFVAGLLIIVLGFVVADFIGDAIQRTRTATETPYTRWFADGTRLFLYFVAIVVGLDTMGIDVSILYVFARAVAWGLAAAIALGLGIAFGWGGKDYVASNIDRWARQGKSRVPSAEGGGAGTGTGTGSSGSAGPGGSGAGTGGDAGDGSPEG